MSNPFPYDLIDSERGYQFKTDFDALYETYFYDGSSVFQGVDFSARVLMMDLVRLEPAKSATLQLKDLRVGATIVDVLQRAFSYTPNLLVVYACSREKKRQKTRSLLFKEWFKGCYDFEIIYHDDDVNENYGGCIYLKSNPDYRDITDEVKLQIMTKGIMPQ